MNDTPTPSPAPAGVISPQELLDALTPKRVEPVTILIDGQPRTVYVREISAEDQDAAGQAMLDDKKAGAKPNYRGRWAAMFLCDAQGKRLFTDVDAPRLGKLQTSTIEAIVEAGRKLNGLRDEDIEAAKKNSAKTPAAD